MPITIHRKSNDTSPTFEDLTPSTKVKDLKMRIRAEFPPAHPKGIRLIGGPKNQVLKSRKKIESYGIKDGEIIEMHDTSNWSDESSTSGSETD